MEHTTRLEIPVSDEELVSDLHAARKFLMHHFRQKGVPLDLAQEAVEDGVVKAFLKAHLWKGKAKRLTYLICVAKRAGIDSLRREATQAKVRRRAFYEAAAERKRLRHGSRKRPATLSELDE